VYRFGVALHETGDELGAVKAYLMAIDTRPGAEHEAAAYLALGVGATYENLGRRDDAEAAYDRYLELSPDEQEAARAAKERAALLSAALQNRSDGLLSKFTSVDDPAQRSVVERERMETLAELERTGTELQQLDQEILDIQEEARRAGVPPGWLR
jgi:tetratricopeptide (TPR) repeat protein